MDQWKQYGADLRRYVNPATFPVAVKLLEDGAAVPESARRPLRDLKVTMAPCQGSAMARRYGWTVVFGPEDQGCAIAAYTHGWKPDIDEPAAVSFLTRMNYAASEAAAKETVGAFRRLDMGDSVHVAYSPLERTKIEPDVVLIFANPAQMMRLIHGATHHTGAPVGGSFSGRAGTCTEGIIGAHLDQAIKVIVPGNGDRVWGGCQDDEMAMAIPASKLAEVVEGLAKTHEKGIRYPIPTYMRYSPEVGLKTPLSAIF